MKILQVVHSFVPQTKAGTEVYSYNLSRELAKRNQVAVFFRTNDPEKAEYSITRNTCTGFETYAINHTFRECDSFKDTYQDDIIDSKFAELLECLQPDIVHIQHLLFLSTGIVQEAKKRGIPVVFTLHDYWLICHRGQLIADDLTRCDGNSIQRCEHCLRYLLRIRGYAFRLYRWIRRKIPLFLLRCLKGMYLLIPNTEHRWRIEERRLIIKEMASAIDLFIAPSEFVRSRFIEHGFPSKKISFSAYGFDHKTIRCLAKTKSPIIRFAYMGTLLPMKGVDILIGAFKRIDNPNIELSIYGRLFSYAGFESYFRRIRKLSESDKRVVLKGEYSNDELASILKDIDVIVLPSRWEENSPLIIQEAFLTSTAVIASNIGGIPQLVKDDQNGLLFAPGNEDDLKDKMQRLIDRPELMERFRHNMPEIKTIEDNARELEQTYHGLVTQKEAAHEKVSVS